MTQEGGILLSQLAIPMAFASTAERSSILDKGADYVGEQCRVVALRGLDHHPGHRASREAAGPHSGPYGTRAYRRVRCADLSPLAAVMIKAHFVHSVYPTEVRSYYVRILRSACGKHESKDRKQHSDNRPKYP